MRKSLPIDHEELSRFLSYEPSTGIFLWKHNFHKSKIGKIAGATNRKGYVMIKLSGRLYSAARLAWVIYHRCDIPIGLEIDHIDRRADNNCIDNLRVVTSSVNCINRNTNLSESCPRYYTRHRNKFQAEFRGKYLGLHKSEIEAMQAVESYATSIEVDIRTKAMP